MTNALVRLFGLAVITFLAGGVLLFYLSVRDDRDEIIQQQAEKIETLENIALRLQTDRRMADILVTDQRRDPQGQLHTRLVFVEYGREGDPLPPRRFEVVGDRVHVETQLIKFERHFVAEGDRLRGKSIVLFTRIYGSATAPDEGALVDEPGRIPRIYRGSDPRVSEFERQLWADFWKLMADTEYATTHGVRVAQGETVWGIFQPEKLYTITLESAGGLSLTNRPLDPVYQEALVLVRGEQTPATQVAHPSR